MNTRPNSQHGNPALENETVTAETPNQAQITLGVLSAIEENSAATQRSISRGLGIALGLTNAYLKRCARKGLIKVRQAPANRYAYYLTPKGFSEKSRLTGEYLKISFNFFRTARTQCAALYAECAARGWQRVVLAGIGDLSEIATLCAAENDVSLVAILDESATEDRHAGLPVFARLEDCPDYDAIIVTDSEAPQAVFDRLTLSVPGERVLAPALLNVSRVRPDLAE